MGLLDLYIGLMLHNNNISRQGQSMLIPHPKLIGASYV